MINAPTQTRTSAKLKIGKPISRNDIVFILIKCAENIGG